MAAPTLTAGRREPANPARASGPPGLERAPHDLVRYLLTLVQLAGVVAVAALFRIEAERRLLPVLILVFVGFAVHAWLPWRFRPWLFLALGLVSLQIVLVPQHAWPIVLIGLLLVGLCHLPVPYGLRVGLVIVAMAALGYLRARTGGTAFGLLGSLFMFRLFLYLFDLRHEVEPASTAQRLSYFFLLPNSVFPLFPVVDPTTYRRSWYNVESSVVHQTGVAYMFTGLLHIIGYRVVYQHWTLAPAEVQSVGDLAQFMVSGYLLYLRVSGMFHLVIGSLCLFGHNLPRSHNHYFLATSFSDLWRRINIYWKDFMAKTVFYPIVLRSRSKGTGVVVATTLVVFVLSWMLHSYQWFWLRGTFPLTWQDGLFWCLLGTLVAVGTVREQRRVRGRNEGRRGRPSLRSAAGLSLRTVGVFLAMSVLWSLWTSSSQGEWLALWSLAGGRAWDGAATVLLVLAAAVLFGIVVQRVTGRDWSLGRLRPPTSFGRSALVTGGGMAALLTVGILPRVVASSSSPVQFLASLQESGQSAVDRQRQTAGYYEGVLSFGITDTALWDASAKQRMPPIAETPIWRFTGDFFDSELVPSSELAWGDGVMHTNRWGMRDRDYTLEKPPGTYRIALVGGSEEMGIGVDDEDVSEAVLERSLNRVPIGPRKVEILNFALFGHFPTQRWMALERRAYRFQPDAVLFAGHDVDEEGTVRFLATSVHFGKPVPFPWLRDVVGRAEVVPGLPIELGKKRLAPYGEAILTWSYRQTVSECRARGIVPLWVFIPSTYEPSKKDAAARRETRLAREAGFETIDLTGVYGERAASELVLSPWDPHPNPLAHRLVAEALEARLRDPEVARRLGLSAEGETPFAGSTRPATPSEAR